MKLSSLATVYTLGTERVQIKSILVRMQNSIPAVYLRVAASVLAGKELKLNQPEIDEVVGILQRRLIEIDNQLSELGVDTER